MDEEEQQQSDSKISVSSFFERVDSVDKVANRALSKANANFDIINNQKTLINSINISIEALETKVRDIANYIIIEKKIEKDAEEDRLFEQQDEAQKGSMLERLAGLKSNNESEQTQAAGEEPKKGGGGGILGTLLTLGVGAFALKFLWPAILPLAGKLITGALAKFAAFSIGGLGTLLKGIVVGTLGGLGIFGLGKMFTNLGNSIKDKFDKIAESSKNAINNFRFGKEGKVDGPDSIEVDSDASGGEEKEMSNLGPDYKQQEEDAFKAAEEYKAEKSNLNLEDNSAVNDMDETLEKKDLKTKKLYIVRGTNMKFDTRDEAVRWILNYIETKKKPQYEESVQSENGVDIDIQNRYENWLKILGQYVKLVEKDRQSITTDEIKRINDLYVDFKNTSPYGFNNEIDPSQSEEVNQAITPETENKDMDLSLSESFSDKLQPLNDQISTLSEDFTGSINAESGQMFSRPANSPNTTVTVFKQTSSNSPFTSLMSNKYLSLNKTLPPEVYRAIK